MSRLGAARKPASGARLVTLRNTHRLGAGSRLQTSESLLSRWNSEADLSGDHPEHWPHL